MEEKSKSPTDLFKTVDVANTGAINKGQIFDLLKERGISHKDARVKDIIGFLDRRQGKGEAGQLDPDSIKLADFKKILSRNPEFLRQVIEGDFVIPSFRTFADQLETIYKKVEANTDGNVASYIPQLAQVDPDQFALSVCTVDGQRFDIGDFKEPFCVQSTCKPINYSIALELHGTDKVHQHVGREPSGQSFNEITLNKKLRPHNPMINAGAIICSSLIKYEEELAERFDYIMKIWTRLAGGRKPGFNNSVYHSEKATADRNFALAHFMREVGAFPQDSKMDQALDLYFQSCSIEMTAWMMANVAATLANGGICPITNDQIFSNKTVKNCLSLMLSCGMYDFSGEFAFSVGLPAKSGVSGALIIIVPGLMGLSLWSPRLDALGNSVRGVEFCMDFIDAFKVHKFDSMIRIDDNRIDPRLIA